MGGLRIQRQAFPVFPPTSGRWQVPHHQRDNRKRPGLQVQTPSSVETRAWGGYGRSAWRVKKAPNLETDLSLWKTDRVGFVRPAHAQTTATRPFPFPSSPPLSDNSEPPISGEFSCRENVCPVRDSQFFLGEDKDACTKLVVATSTCEAKETARP